MAFGISPVTPTIAAGDNPPVTSDGFPRFIQFQNNGTDLGGPDVSTVNFRTGAAATRGTGENANTLTVDFEEREVWATQTAGVDETGATDSTAGLLTFFTLGGDLYVPEGDYLIAAAGADTGGVYVTITKDTRVVCHPNARFFTNGLDNDMIRFTVPSDGAGLPADGVTFDWMGGYFDQSGQKNSTVIPFSTEYPPSNPGASATCDALSIRGDYTDGGGVVRHGIKRATVAGVTTYAGDHWETAGGGDGAIFMGGCQMQEHYYCRHIGARDLGMYFSGDPTGVLQCKSMSLGGYYENCFGGVSSKRSSGDVDFIGGTFINCPRAMAIEHLVGSGNNRIHIAGNTGRNCGILARVTYANGGSIIGNHFTHSGSLLADGTTAESFGGLDGWVLRGCTHIHVTDNTALGMNATAAAAYASTQRFLYTESFDPGSGSVATSYCTFTRNECDGWARLGTDTGDRNTFVENLATNASLANVTMSGTNGHEVRIDSSNVRVFNTPVQFNDGSAAAPAIARRGQASNGIYFGTSSVGISAAGSNRIVCNATGIGFFGSTPVTRAAAAAAATDLATAITLVNDLRTKLINYGLAI